MALSKQEKARMLMKVLLLLEEEEDELMLVSVLSSTRRKVLEMFRAREKEGYNKVLIENHLMDNDIKFREFFRLSRNQFQFVLDLVSEDITLLPCNRVKNPVSAFEKLAITLRFLATGESYKSLSFGFRISDGYISRIVPLVLQALCKKLVSLCLPPPTAIDFAKKEEEFSACWNFPNLVGGIDGKHVRIMAPDNTGSLYHNYKGYFSIVLLALVDANYKFVIVNAGSYGKEGDSGILNKTPMGYLIYSGQFFPTPKPFPNTNTIVPHVVVGDEAFKLGKHLLRPYPRCQALKSKMKSVFNYRLSRARRVTENAFGIMCNVFRIFFTPINVKPETVDSIIMASCCLHNLLRDEYLQNPNPLVQEEREYPMPVENMIPLRATGGFSSKEGFAVRKLFKEYFNSENGSVSWQNAVS